MSRKQLVICDTEEEYAHLLADFVLKDKNLPWEVRTFTDPLLLQECKPEEIAICLIAETAFTYAQADCDEVCTVVLSESGKMPWSNVQYVDKYQAADEILRFLLRIHAEMDGDNPVMIQKNLPVTLLGLYTPVHRSSQTSYALAMSRILSDSHATLYLNFEYCGGIGELLPDMNTMDLADLLYFVPAGQEKFRNWLHTIRRRFGTLDYIPPMKSGQNLLTVSLEDWKLLLQRIESLGEYEIIILDLSESLQGLFEILRMCNTVYTLTESDRISKSKLLQYEQLLELGDYDDVLEKTKKLQIPRFKRFPDCPEQLTKSEFAVYVRKEMEEGWNIVH